MDVRRVFVERLRAGERMSDLCREFGISRQTGNKLKRRFERAGEAGLADRPRGPKHVPWRTPPEIADRVLALKAKYPTWGAKKLLSFLSRHEPDVRWPCRSTIDNLLSRNGLVQRRPSKRRRGACPSPMSTPQAPNDLWCIDYKGHFRTGDRRYCYPLTLTDQFSRFLLSIEGYAKIDGGHAKEACTEVFRTHGLPAAIRSDNGPPFASTGLLGLSRLNVWWMRLGIRLERIEPGCPQQNGQHERMHRTLKQETTRPAAENLLSQQQSFDAFRDIFNNKRPHEAIGQRCPADLYIDSSRLLPNRLEEPTYPLHDDVRRVDSSGRINLGGRRRLYLSTALVGQLVGLREDSAGWWCASFLDLPLGYYNLSQTELVSTKPNSTKT